MTPSRIPRAPGAGEDAGGDGTRDGRWYYSRILIGAALLPFAPSLAFGFAQDDAFAVLGHRGVKGTWSAVDLLLRDFWGRSRFDTIGAWRPTATLSYALDWQLGGGKPLAFHATNLALYAALLFVFERFLRRFFADEIPWRGRLAAVGAFGVLAIHADVVPSVTGRAEILAALFVLLGLLATLREDGPPRAREIAASTGLVLLAIGSKESALPAALLVPLLANRWHARRGTDGGRALRGLATANVAALAGVVAFRALRMPWIWPGPERAAENPLIVATVPGRLSGAAAVLAHYLAHLAWPARLAPDYSYAAMDVAREPVLAFVGVAVATCAAVTVARHRTARGIVDAILGFGASYVVVSHVATPAIAVMADRLFFFPSLWVVTLGTLLAVRATRAIRGGVAALGVAFVAGQAIVAARDCTHWRDDVTLLSSAVEARPNVARSRRNLAQALGEAGRPDEAAWQGLVMAAILARFPWPVPESDFPASWEAQPVSARVDALALRLGACPFRDRLGRARASFEHWGMLPEAAVIDGWLRDARAETSGAGCRGD